MNALKLELHIAVESWPISGTFTISRGSKTAAEVITVEVREGSWRGYGECVPYPRYNETIQNVVEKISAAGSKITSGFNRKDLQSLMPAGAARNAIDCALWDLEAKRENRPVYEIAGLSQPRPLITAYTISLDTPDKMATAARKHATRPLLKIKLGATGDPERIRAVRTAAPLAELIVDANEGWTPDNLAENIAACAEAGVTLVEQPLPAQNDDALAHAPRPIPICADESIHDRSSLPSVIGKYDAINIKLDKTGGLTEALALADEAKAKGLSVMVGCMISTSLSIAPALLVAQNARVVDLDGPLLLAHDRPNGIRFENNFIHSPPREFWG